MSIRVGDEADRKRTFIRNDWRRKRGLSQEDDTASWGGNSLGCSAQPRDARRLWAGGGIME